MTTERDEIEIQGSNDGQNWKPFRFRWKPQELSRRPAFVAPHMPRLDWQMWFAALGPETANFWFPRLLEALRQGEPAVLSLIDGTPFPNGPPKWMRARLYRYRFTTPAEKKQTGDWWVREELGPYAEATAD